MRGLLSSPISGQGNNLAFVGAYILAGELKAANRNYMQAFTRYNALLRSFVEANQQFGVWVSESFLVEDEVSKKIAALIKPHDLNAELELIYQTIDGLHEACPQNLGDWYFSGNYPTPGGNKVSNRAFVNYMEGKNTRAY